jgi:hypothetical protein
LFEAQPAYLPAPALKRSSYRVEKVDYSLGIVFSKIAKKERKLKVLCFLLVKIIPPHLKNLFHADNTKEKDFSK